MAVALTTASVAAHAVGATRQAHAGTVAQPSGTVKEDGSGLLLPLVQAWAPAYHRQYPAATVITGGGGSGVGINDAISGKVQVGTSDAYLSSGDEFIHPDLLNIPLVTSAQSVIYDLPGVPRSTHVHLSGAILAQMYRGTITNWGSVYTDAGYVANLSIAACQTDGGGCPAQSVPAHRQRSLLGHGRGNSRRVRNRIDQRSLRRASP